MSDFRTPNDIPAPGRWLVVLEKPDGSFQRHPFPWREDTMESRRHAFGAATDFLWLSLAGHADWNLHAVFYERWSDDLARYVGERQPEKLPSALEPAAPRRKRAF